MKYEMDKRVGHASISILEQVLKEIIIEGWKKGNYNQLPEQIEKYKKLKDYNKQVTG